MKRRLFGPKRVGVGVRPVGWLGWAATLALVAGVVALGHWPGLDGGQRAWRIVVLLLVYGGLVVFTYGPEPAPPASPDA